ncbi:MAG: aspartate aminotransferase family protein [Chloroflexota bacterium]
MTQLPHAVYDDFAKKFPTSLERYEEAKQVFPAGVTHDGRFLQPAPIYATHAKGATKWDVDGNEIIDYWMGHGALLLGHNPPEVVDAVAQQLQRGTHYGASHELEIKWGQWVQKLIPSAEKVRFVASGTEATMMAIRLARGFTGRKKLVRFTGHFHGWHDTVMLGVSPPYDVPNSVGIPEETLSTVVCLPPNDMEAVEQMLRDDEEIAAVILEPAGGSNATIPTRPGFLQALRDLCTQHGVILIFDEVISGFRYAAGGAQEHFGVTPDMTSLAKILAGGLPGGAVAGRADIMAQLDFTDDAYTNRHQRMSHPGTFNGNPLSAAAGIAALGIASTGEPQRQAGVMTLKLIEGMNDILKRAEIPGCVYGDIGSFHLLVGQTDFRPEYAEDILAYATPERLSAGMGRLKKLVRLSMLLEGSDVPGSSGRLSSVHTETTVDKTLAGFEAALDRLTRWEVL